MSSFSRSDIKKFLFENSIYKTLNESTIDIPGLEIDFDSTGITINNKRYSLSALTVFGEYSLKILSIEEDEEGGILISASTEIKDVKKPLLPNKLEQIKKAVDNDESQFIIDGKLANIKFTKVS
jgi:hypothetical protein